MLGAVSRTTLRSFSNVTGGEMAYAEQRLIGYSRQQMFDVVASVIDYHNFVPWCRRSIVKNESPNVQIAELEIGFPPLLESYTSRVTTLKPVVVHSVCIDQTLFRRLETTFKFGEGLPQNDNTCTLYYDLIFEFQSSMHRRIAHIFFDKVVKAMVGAFMKRAEERYGPPSIQHRDAKILTYKS